MKCRIDFSRGYAYSAPGLGTSADLARRQPKSASAALDLVPEKLESLPDVHDPRLLRMELHAQLLQNPKRRRHRRTRLRRRRRR